METCLSGLLLWCFHLELLWAAGIFQYQRSSLPKARTPKSKEWMPPSSSSVASAFTWVPTPSLEKADPEGLEAAVAFLYSGDVSRLLQANCTRRFEVRDVGKASSPPPALRSYLRGATDTLSHATNFLNMVFQTNDIRESSVKEDVEWYHALVRSIMEGDAQVYRAVLTFDAHPVSSKPQLMLQAIKENNEILLQDLSPSAESLRNLTWENEWYNFFRFQRAPTLYKRILSNDLKTLDTPKWGRGDSYVMDTGHVKWSPPFLECEDGKFLPNWMVTLSSSFYGLKPDLNPEFKGVVRMDVKIQNADINQCASGQGWFANTHQCDLNSTQCIPQESQGFVLGKYLCLCKPGFYGLSKAFSSSSSSNGQSGESTSQYGAVDSGNFLECRPCQEGCTTCVDSTPCLIQEDWSLRAAILAFQAFCMLAVFLSMLVSYHFRKSKRIRASGIVLLETILFGSLLLYFPVFILYFKPSIFRCIVLRWVRMLGFAIVYGTITLKLYRVLKVFLSRTAQRVPYMTSGRVLKMLALILLLVLWFLAAWTVGMLENIEKNIPLVVRSQTTRGLQFYICDHDRWDYMMVVAEILFLFWGSFLCYATRTVPSAFHEPRYMGIALHNELITSAAFHIVRFLMVPSLHPDWTLLLFFIHTHITTTMTLALLFIPKFLHAGTPLREEIAAEVYEDELDLRRSGSYLNSSITSAWSEHSLDPDDIRDELKKLYTQLEVHKTKKMTANNPHLQKKRSSKRGLGRSFMRRITEIPESMSRQCSREEKGGSVGGGSRSRSSSYQRRRLDSGSSSVKLKDDSSSKHKAASSLKKSHSTSDHMGDIKENSLPTRHDSCKEAPLLDSMMRRKLAKKASERSNSDSLDDSAPLVYKSASAHNLMADKKPLHPRPSPLQKSLSVVTSAKEKALLVTSRAYLEDSNKQAQDEERRRATEAYVKGSDRPGKAEVNDGASEVIVKPLQMDDTSEGTVSSLLEESSSSKDTGEPCEAVTALSTPSETRSQKHVTYTPIRSISINTSDMLRKRQHTGKKTPPEPPIRQQSLGYGFERRDVVSGDVEDQMQPSAQSPQKDSTDIPMLVNICPWEKEDSPEKTELERSKQTEGGVPHSSPVGLNRLASIAAEVCPWEVMEVPVSSKKDSQGSDLESQKSSPEKQTQSPQISPPKSSLKSLSMAIKAFNRSKIKASIKARKEGEGSPGKNEKDKDTTGKPRLAEVASIFLRGSPVQVTSRSPGESRARVVSKQATVCPWDEEEEEVLPSPQRSSSSKALEIGPWEMSPDDLAQGRASSTENMAGKNAGKISSATQLERTKNQWESTCPWEAINACQNKEEKTSSVPLVVSKTDNKKTEVCPWEVAEDTVNTQRETSRALSVKEGKGKPSDGYRKWTSSREALSTETQDKVTGQCDSREIKEPSLGTENKKSPDLSKVDQKKFKSVEKSKAQVGPWKTEEAGMSPKTQICPWEVEEPPTKEKISVDDSKGSSKEEKIINLRGVAMKKPEDCICPWETMELPAKSEAKTAAAWKKSDDAANIKAEMCPWETTDVPSEKPGEDFKETESYKLKSLESKKTKDAPSRKLERLSSPQDSVCPWENAGAEDFSINIPDPSKGVLKTSSRVESKKVEVCPWETETGEVCSPEVTASPLGERTKQVGGEPSRVILKMAQPLKTQEEKMQHDPICPWESTESEGTLVKPSTKSLDPSKGSSKKLDSFQSKRAAIAPWETQEAEADIKTAICPWECSDIPTPKGTLEKNVSMLSREENKETRESACPSDSAGSKDLFTKPKPKSPDVTRGSSKKSDSMEGQKAAICPWEVEDTEVDAKTEICPWERTQTPSDKRSSKQDTGGASERTGDIRAIPPEKVTSPRESICPWETVDTDDLSSGFSVKSPGLSKVGSRKSHSIESLKAEAYPWETQEAELLESPLSRTPSSKGGWTHESVRHPLLKQTGLSMERASSPRESICPWESADDTERSAKPEVYKIPLKKSDSDESLKAEVCPWEVTEGPAKKSILRKDDGRSPIPISYSKTMEKLSSSREEICPWESMELEEASAGSFGPSPALSKAGSWKSDSAESLRAEICPWETVELEESSTEEMSPWTTVIAPFEKGKLKQELVGPSKVKKGKASSSPDSKKSGGEAVFRKVEKSKSHQESVLPWGSMDFDKPPAKSTKSLDLLHVSSKKSDSAESLKAEICPWEFQEIIQMRDKTEICPWEGAEGPPERGTMREDKGRSSEDERSTSPMGHLKSVEKVSSSRESICPWESMELFSGSSTPDLSKAGSKKSGSVESLRAEVCPWEMEEDCLGSSVEMHSRKPAQVPTCKEKLRQEGKAQTQTRPGGKKAGKEMASKMIEKTRSHQELVSHQKSTNELAEKLSSRSLDFSSVGANKSDSVESRRAGVCPWETQEVDFSANADVCPWEVAEAPSEKGTSGKDVGEVSKGHVKAISKALEKDSSFRESLCPWESTTTAEVLKTSDSTSVSSKRSDSTESRKADICPWEVDLPRASSKEEICPWQAGTVLPIKKDKHATHPSSTEMPKGDAKRSESKQEGLAGHKPLCRSLPESTQARGLCKGSSPLAVTSAKSRGERCPWEVEEDPTSTRKDAADISKAFSAVCPWETEDTSPTSVIPGKSKAGEKPKGDDTKDPSKVKSDVCPWDCD
ncbi:probable G-protein coupled receptor 179 [Tiliqua scincoides]|uniref:probable G-protein coupled receptor 179 n=1 Tax=Tiliqua scincoides TaxID=71010 RepID=UPI003461B087